MKLTNHSRNLFVIIKTRPNEQEILLGRNETVTLDDERFQRLRRSPVVSVLLDRRLLVASRVEENVDQDDPGSKVSEAQKPPELEVSNSRVDNGKRPVEVDSTATAVEVPVAKVSDPDAPAGGRRAKS
ncbi:MAG: hypothetical protein KID05_10430 [Pseudomonas sp.]|uniref:hypothetical protein n=1 Tax=Pseudomonas sp. TaxID=306 RepID=UPI002354A478|nr:hypothetical protein [Pseudomonas sp.]MBS5839572.1 hypothetical protein [Pseudomonas sp.]